MNFSAGALVRNLRMKIHRIDQALRRIARGIAQGDLGGTIRYCASFVRSIFTRKTRWQARTAKAAQDLFDSQSGSDTALPVKVRDMEVQGKNYVYASVYFPIDPSILRNALQSLEPLPFEEFAFIDLGSGKGRALLVASEFPFREVIGVEFAADLHRVARENIARYRSPMQRCFEISSVHMDVLEYELPPVPTVIFMFNPFEWPVMSRVLANIEGSLMKHPRELIIIYADPRDARAVERERFIRPFSATPQYRIYRCAAAVSASR